MQTLSKTNKNCNLIVSTEASWWNILNLKTHTTLGYIVSLILLDLAESTEKLQLFCWLRNFKTQIHVVLQLQHHSITRQNGRI